MIFDRIVESLSRLIPYPDLKKEQAFVEWKNKLLILLLGAIVFIGPMAFIPGLAIAISEKIWGLAISNIVIYSILVFVALSRKLGSNIKVLVCIVMFYLLGLSVFIQVGPKGSGFNWVFIFILLSTFFYGGRGAAISLCVTFGSLMLLLVPIYFEFPLTENLREYGLAGWFVNVLMFTVVSLLFSLSLNVVLVNIDHSLRKEQEISHLLKENQVKLEEQRNRAEESDRLKSQFLANMSHEIRTPMNSLLGFSNLIAEQDLSDELKSSYKNIINHSGEQLIRIIDDIIDIAKIESNQMKIGIEPVNIIQGLKEVVDINKNRISNLNKPIDIFLKIPIPVRDIVIETDGVRFKQIVNNLIDNAIKYTDNGLVEIGYDLLEDGTAKFIEFYVKDNGKGIPKELQNDIFKRFSQASNIDFQQGTGLGLSIVKGLLDLLGGSVRVDSEVNKGSIFYFRLPFDEVKYNFNKSEIRAKHDIPDFSGKTIFIAEDEEYSYLLISQVLQKTGALTRHANHGRELMEMLEKELPDLVLLDINMPVLNGFKTMELLRKKYPVLTVVAQTAYAMADERKKCFECGCNGYLAKPIKPNDLYEELKLFLI